MCMLCNTLEQNKASGYAYANSAWDEKKMKQIWYNFICINYNGD